MKMRSVMEHAFSRVPQADIPRSSFDRSHGYKTTFDAGVLVPFFVDEALPGDTFNLRLTGFARLATMIYPIMDNIFMDTHFFAVPMRLIWDNWERFNGAQTDPGDSTDFLIPTHESGGAGFGQGGLHDYMGIPTLVGAITTVNTLPFRAYNLIWNEWFRDQNLQDSVNVPRNDGPDSAADFANCLPRGKRHDYFTSCLPWPQKGDSVTLPLLGDAPIKTTTTDLVTGAAPAPMYLHRVTDGADATASRVLRTAGETPSGQFIGSALADSSVGDGGLYPSNLYADLNDASLATINQLRQAFQIQRLLERDARGGTRYTEIIRSHFGVTSPDARLQRPEYLGGGSSRINVSPVATTTQGTRDVGDLAAFGTAHLNGHGFTKSFTEHCYVIGLVSVRADLTYQQGMQRMWSRETRYDFYWPALAQIGEQAVLNGEIFYQGAAADENVFGYQERYAEYRYKPSQVTGNFRSNASGTLDAWHLSQDFATLPVLDDTFIVENPPIDRVIATPSEPQFLFDSYINFRCARPMPMFGVPGLIDHF